MPSPKKEKTDDRTTETNKRTPEKVKTPRPVLETALLRSLPYKSPVGNPGPPSSPSTSSLSPSKPSSFSPSLSWVGIMKGKEIDVGVVAARHSSEGSIDAVELASALQS